MAKVLAGSDYPSRFSTPRNDAHDTVLRAKMPTLDRYIGNRLSPPVFRGVSLPATLARHDIIHAFNFVPIGIKPFIVSFEGELPRVMGDDDAALRARRFLRRCYFSSRCRGLFPISQFALKLLRNYARDWPEIQEDRFQPTVVYPNIPLRGSPKNRNPEGLVLTFVGAHWARKGGAVCARLSAFLTRRGISHQMHIVSSLQYGSTIYTDSQASFYQPDIALLQADPIMVHGGLQNQRVLDLMQNSDFLLLPTLDDSFGFSLLEAMAAGTPCIATNICAIPEIIDDGIDGLLIDMPVDDMGRWNNVYANTPERQTEGYQDMLDDLFTTMARDIADRLERVLDEGGYESLSHGAMDKIRTRFSADAAARQWHDIYTKALDRT